MGRIRERSVEEILIDVERCERGKIEHQMYLTEMRAVELSSDFDVIYQPIDAFGKSSATFKEGARQKRLYSVISKRHESCKSKCQLEKIGGTCKGLPCARMKS